MIKLIQILSVVLILITTQVYSQEPSLDSKGSLPTTLHSSEIFNSSGVVNVIELPIDMYQNMSIEIKATINSSEGRGLDFDLRKKDFTGFRTSLSSDKFQWTTPLSSAYMMNFSSTEEQTIRYAVEGNTVHIYQNGSYIDSKNLETIYDIVDGIENANPDLSEMTEGPNITENAFGNLTTQTPFQAGWNNNGANNVPWNTPNSGSGVRFINSLNNNLTYNGQTYTGTDHFMMMRWESGVSNGSSYYYPVTLEANTTYNLNTLYTYWGNGTSGTFKISTSQETTGNNIINQFSTTIGNGNQRKLTNSNLAFTTTEAGTYYLLFENDGQGIWFVGNLSLKKFGAQPRIVLGKNYPEGAVNMQVASVTFDGSGAYAPVSSGDYPKTPVSITDEDYSITRFINAEITVSGKSEVHITDFDPLRNSTVNLTSDESWLYIERIKPSIFLNEENSWLDNVKINGQPFDGAKDRIAVYASGCVIIPNGNIAMQEALTIYTEENFGGDAISLEVETYHNDLGAFNNNVKSFKLKKGFAATLANNANGTGYSRMFIASDEDMEVSMLPEGFVKSATDQSSFVSFIRVFKWQWNSKKGISNALAGEANYKASPTISYNWSAGGNNENVDASFVPMRHNLGWDSFTKINSLTNVSHVLGYNEPARPDQANMSVASAINQWPEIFKSGLRIGSPAPAAIGSAWLNEFMQLCDELNYRVDFIAFHAYQDQPTSWWGWNISSASIGGRPVWITEWNNGANWTNGADASKWPDVSGPRFYPNGDPILDESGVQKTGSLPLTPANAERNRDKLEQILSYFETNDLVEHHFLYQWVNDARTLELGGQLTLAGEMFGEFNSGTGFKKANEYSHNWKIAPPWVNPTFSEDYSQSILTWYDHNGETGKHYILERKTDMDTDFVPIATLVNGEDYVAGEIVSFSDPITYTSAIYRVRAMSYKDTQSSYSREVNVVKDQPAAAPVLIGTAVSGTIIQLDWNSAANAKRYTIKRSNSMDGVFETIVENLDDLTYRDENLTATTTYYYKIVGVNSSGEGEYSSVIDVTTNSIDAPNEIENLYISSGDAANIITWNFVFDTYYNISKSSNPNGPFTSIANNFDGVRYVDNINVVNGSTYYYKVQPVNTEGVGPESNVLVANPNLGQHAKFTFNENSGIIAYDEWGGFHGELKNNAIWSTGNNGSAVTLSETEESYVQLGENVVYGLRDFSIVSWFKTPAVTNNYLRLFDFGSAGDKYMLLIPKANETESRFIISPLEGNRYNIYMPCDFPDDEWVHVALTLEGTTLKYFINGELVFTDNNCNLTPSDVGETHQNYLGKSQQSQDKYTNQSYDDFRIYNYALDASDITYLSNNITLTAESLDVVNERLLQVYPNPIGIGQDFNIKLNNKVQYKNATIRIYNILGEVIESNRMDIINQIKLTAPKTSGIYIIDIEAGNYSAKAKIVVK
ncbi:glycosyl hydrolase [Algibacter miyuki]|uniref:Glycosyl hydrolase n=1 Tax=Algibacter miyuki TaxID=1306933 RepID=A0ABV5H0N0_9FLAO|nr:glycosyl hydrolase [Algibacter miyuki]MDN3667549.1 glycosyl hydrolase [Algibacter miyuki]